MPTSDLNEVANILYPAVFWEERVLRPIYYNCRNDRHIAFKPVTSAPSRK
ncbi:hypothetical protein Q2T83_11200 [Fervidibacter sacchari]|uniref:Uncharacterized protein n=1 Tax=Candidatus Fervidibacter sacchari TaxID=1448929 RepID=A0ABT2ESM4_9BACT|nr:hypothetical protein [Candidatus Fervidibacter sacchari]MCS3920956.1 hypothetical protein [Candidatus Fervidibacter sacchari]WKU14902.1 hypothetical protein Q2T83_11200 [Candidatus Fervidibacter sacchari]